MTYPISYIFFSVLFLCIGYGSLIIDYKILIVSIFVVTLIYQLNKKINLAISIFLSYFIISACGLLIGKYCFYLIVLYFLYFSVAILRSRIITIKNIILKNFKILDFIGIIIFSFFISVLLLEENG